MRSHTDVRIDVPEATAALARPAALRFRFGGSNFGCRLAVEAMAAPTTGGDSGTALRLTSLYRGPLLLAYDLALNGGEGGLKPGLDAAALRLAPGRAERRWLAPQLLVRMRNRDGKEVRLCDFASAGLSGSRYETWLPVKDAPPPASFARNNPLRSQRNQPMQGNQK